jgi:hypothetical protein
MPSGSAPLGDFETGSGVSQPLKATRDGRTDAALQEVVANWQRLTPSVTDAIMKLVRTRKA